MDTSSVKTNLAQYSITPFEGKWQDFYTKEQWLEEVSDQSMVYYKSIPYQKGEIKSNIAEGWMLLVIIFGFGCLAYVRSMHRKRFNMLIQTLFNWKVSKQIIRYEKVYTHPVNLILTLNFIICFPLFFSISIHRLNYSELAIEKLFFIILMPLIIYLIFKLLSYKFSSWLMKEKEAIEEYVFQANLFNKYLGIIYLILAALLIYSPISMSILVKGGVMILLLFLFFQLIRGILVGIENGKSLFLIILYLCTLEILPWLILGKWVRNLL